MKRRVFSIFLLFFVFLHQVAFAARSVTINSDKGSLFGDESMTISASISGFTDGEIIYIKGAFFKDGSTNYFGYTQNGDSWIKNSITAGEQRQVTIGSWDTTAIVKSDFNDSGYVGQGDYQFKLGFYYYTSGGNLSSVNWSNILSTYLDEPVQTPTDLPTSTTTSSSTPTSKKTPTPSKTPTPGRNSSATKAPTQAVKSSTTVNSSSKNKISAKITPSTHAGTFADFRNESPAPSKGPESINILGAKERNLLFLVLPVGLILLMLSLGIAGYKYREIIKTWINS